MGSAYPAAYQLALDMLYRLNAFGSLLSVLLERKQVISALRLASPRSVLFDGTQYPGLVPSEFLRVAKETGDPSVFYACYKFFESRNVALRGHPAFASSDGCQSYTSHFLNLFGTPDASPLVTPLALAWPTPAPAASSGGSGSGGASNSRTTAPPQFSPAAAPPTSADAAITPPPVVSATS